MAIYMWREEQPIWSLSTDFTQYSSLAEIQAQWWTWITSVSSTAPNYSYGSNGIAVRNPSSWGKHWWPYVKLPSKITAQNKVLIKYTANVSIGWGIFMTLCTTTKPDLWTNNQTEISYSQTARYSDSAVSQWLGAQKSVNGVKSWWLWMDFRSIVWIAWMHEAEVILDIPNGTAKWICTSPSWMAYTSEATVSADWLACIVGTEYFIIRATDYNRGVTTYIRSWEIKVY